MVEHNLTVAQNPSRDGQTPGKQQPQIEKGRKMLKKTGGPANDFVDAYGIVLENNSLVGGENPLPVTITTA